MKDVDLKFEMAHLDRYAIIDEPCTIIVRNNSHLDYNNLYDEDGHPRWLLNLKVITRGNFEFLKNFDKDKTPLTYRDIGHLLIVGALWENQVSCPEDLPVKGEEVIAVFDYVEEVLRCTAITVIPRIQPELYLHASHVYDEIAELERIIKDIGNEE